MRRLILTASFAAGFAIAYVATNYFAAFALEWWDPKSGSAAGGFAFSLTLLPYLLIVSSALHAVGIALSWTRVQAASVLRLVAIQVAAGILADALPFAYSAIAREIAGRAPPTGANTAVEISLFLLCPGAVTWLAWQLLSNRTVKSERIESAA